MYLLNEQAYKDIPNEVVCVTDNSGTDFMKWIEALRPDNIEALINRGEVYAKLFMKYRGIATINRAGRGIVKDGHHTTNQRYSTANNASANKNADNTDGHNTTDDTANKSDAFSGNSGNMASEQ